MPNHDEHLAKGLIHGPRPVSNGDVVRVNTYSMPLSLCTDKCCESRRRQAVRLHILEWDVVARRLAGFKQLDRPVRLGDDLSANMHLDMPGGASAVKAMVGIMRMSNDLLLFFKPSIQAAAWGRKGEDHRSDCFHRQPVERSCLS